MNIPESHTANIHNLHITHNSVCPICGGTDIVTANATDVDGGYSLAATGTGTNQELRYYKWQTEKPEFKEECLLLVASSYQNKDYDYNVFEIKQIEGLDEQENPAWYWGICCLDGEEWGDYEDLKADLYMIMPLLNNQTHNK
jgi:hypothetical protein